MKLSPILRCGFHFARTIVFVPGRKRGILKEMIILHVYMFPVGYKEKQQISELLDLSTKSQRIMDSKKIGKG